MNTTMIIKGLIGGYLALLTLLASCVGMMVQTAEPSMDIMDKILGPYGAVAVLAVGCWMMYRIIMRLMEQKDKLYEERIKDLKDED